VHLGHSRVALHPDASLADRDAEFDTEAWMVRFRPGLSPARTKALITHELLHGLFAVTELDADPKVSRVEEQVVTRLAPALLALLRANPKLVAWLLDDEGEWA
jgi:hypothetical protein